MCERKRDSKHFVIFLFFYITECHGHDQCWEDKEACEVWWGVRFDLWLLGLPFGMLHFGISYF